MWIRQWPGKEYAMRKRITAILAALLLVLTWALPVRAAEPANDTGTGWSFDQATGTLSITGAGKMADYRSDGSDCPWNEIRQEIRALKVQEGITELGAYAMAGCRNLSRIELPRSLMVIGNGALLGCTGLTGLDLPEELTGIGSESFRNCTGIQSLNLPQSLMRIGAGAFQGCTGLQSVTMGDTLVELGKWSFYGCSGLSRVELGKGLKKIGDSAFQNCKSLPQVELPKGLTELGAYAFAGCGALKSISIPNSISELRPFTFAGCGGLTQVALARSVKTIGVWVFQDCVSLQQIVIPANAAQIRDCAFHGCMGLGSVYFMGNAPELGQHVFQFRPQESTTDENIPGLTLYYLDGRTGWDSPLWNGYSAQCHAHRNADTVKSPTCTEKGYTTHVCMDCGAVSVDSYVNALGHDYMAETKAATCTAGGYITHTCARCGDRYEDGRTGALGHAYRDGVCTRCGAKDPNWTKPTEPDPTEPEPMQNPFVDVREENYYYNAVLWAVNKGVTAGVDSTHFAPNGICTRAQVVAFLWRAAGKPEPKTTKNPFADVAASSYYYKAVLWASENGIVYGTDSAHFSPNDSCTRAQVVCFLYRYQHSPGHGTRNPFRDVSGGRYYYDAVLWAAENGIVYGTDSTHFSPNEVCTRAQVVCFLYRLLG